MDNLLLLWSSSGLAQIGVGQAFMMLIGAGLLFLAIRKGFEPLLLVPIGFGGILANIPGAGLAYSAVENAVQGADPQLLLEFARLFGVTATESGKELLTAYGSSNAATHLAAEQLAMDAGYSNGMLYNFYSVAIASGVAPLPQLTDVRQGLALTPKEVCEDGKCRLEIALDDIPPGRTIGLVMHYPHCNGTQNCSTTTSPEVTFKATIEGAGDLDIGNNSAQRTALRLAREPVITAPTSGLWSGCLTCENRADESSSRHGLQPPLRERTNISWERFHKMRRVS